MLGMMRFATIERADSLAGILNFLATQGPNENPLVIRRGRRARDDAAGARRDVLERRFR